MSIDGKWIRENETKEFKEKLVGQQEKEVLLNSKKEMFNNLVSNGMDRTFAYQIAYNISHEEAKQIVAEESYKALISCGIDPEIARKLAYKEEENNSKTR